MQALNPFLPSYEYVPDGEPHVFGDRVYLYGSHDKFNGFAFCLNDYVCWSADIHDLGDWRYEGVIYHRSQDPRGCAGFMNALYAPDVCEGSDGRYYLYYFMAFHNRISVAVSDSPAGPFAYLDDVHYADGTPLGGKKEPLQFDPGVLYENGHVYLYTGFGPVGTPSVMLGGHRATKHGPMAFVLREDMLTVEKGLQYIGVKGEEESKGTPYEGHAFFEASSMRKLDNTYYFIYSTMNSHELAYATGDNPLGPFTYGGVLVSNGDVGLQDEAMNYTGNTHGSIARILGKDYIFYHRQTNRHAFSRQACAEQLHMENGRFLQAEMTSCGLNGKSLGKGTYGAYIACQLYSKNGTYMYGPLKKVKGIHPYFTQTGADRNENPTQYIANMADGATAVFKYFTWDDATTLAVSVRGYAEGTVTVFAGDQVLCTFSIHRGKQTYTAPLKRAVQNEALKFVYTGQKQIDFYDFTIS